MQLLDSFLVAPNIEIMKAQLPEPWQQVIEKDRIGVATARPRRAAGLATGVRRAACASPSTVCPARVRQSTGERVRALLGARAIPGAGFT